MTDPNVDPDAEGADEQNANTNTERQPSARELELERLASGRISAIADENDASVEEMGGTPPPDAPASAPAPTTPPSQPSELDAQIAAQFQDGVIPDEVLGKLKVKVVVDGEERLVPLDEARRNFQIESAARRRLNEANHLLEEAKRQTATPAAAAAATPATEGPAFDLRAKLKEKNDALFAGDVEKVTEIEAEIFEHSRASAPQTPAAPKPTEIAAQVKWQIEVDSASEQFKTDYSDIVADPWLAGIADSFLNKAIAEGKRPQDAFKEAGEATRSWLRARSGVPANQTTTTPKPSDTRQQRKQGLDSLPAAHATTGSTVAPPQTHADKLREMAAARGQAGL